MQKIASPSIYDFRIHYKETGAVWKLSSYFLTYIPFEQHELVFLCIGSDRSTGDSLGPLAGTYLAQSPLFPFHIIGTLEEPLHALNLVEKVEEAKQQYPNAYFIAIDACLGKFDSIGHILFQNGPIYPGKAVGKNLPPVGQIAIKGVVNIGGFLEQSVLQSTRLYIPYEMSHVIGRALQLAYSRFHSKKEVHNRNKNSNNCNTGNQISYTNLRQAD